MNKLEEYKKNWAVNKWDEDNTEHWRMSSLDLNKILKEGFDAAIALDLPVKFSKWKTELLKEQRKKRNNSLYVKLSIVEGRLVFVPSKNEGLGLSDKTLYQYWIEKIYKPE